ncbi:ABC transporter related [Methylobacterium sp. 4-46]|uniref:ABC transporter ATP-binding protein n=1 Tax=unclassified Methylobacterium TaxID=2615210 RepID=UPI000152E35C|nr:MULTISPECIES: ABC transporter ATP-binding protein [Methylobacterium]ACA18403.1 ABC transporter related [Methylobacterium sp. 4-46]WFT83614.1 ABC transporter ATP-binding protein [Methylobacterium nodulans]
MRAGTGRSVVLDGITHRYGEAVAVGNVTLDIKGGELVSLLGPSGCGKTTLLRIVAGFLRQTEGRVIVGDAVMDDLPPSRRAVGIVFQNYALFPHLSVAENVAYGLAARGAPRAEQEAEAERLLGLVQLGAMAERYPRQLSGGQQQRVALARALAIRPAVLLLDEPFAALDKNLRLDMQIEVKRLQRVAGVTTILVTHDQEEALSLSDRVAVLSQGRLEQFAAPTTIYDAPESLFVNTFVGSANTMPGRVVGQEGAGARVALDAGGEIVVRRPGRALAPGARVVACLRPEHLRLTDGEEGIAGVVEMALPLGPTVIHEVRVGAGGALKVAEPRLGGAAARPPGTAVRVAVAPGLASAFPAA